MFLLRFDSLHKNLQYVFHLVLDQWYLHIINKIDFPFTAKNNLKLLKMIDACILSNNSKKTIIIDL